MSPWTDVVHGDAAQTTSGRVGEPTLVAPEQAVAALSRRESPGREKGVGRGELSCQYLGTSIVSRRLRELPRAVGQPGATRVENCKAVIRCCFARRPTRRRASQSSGVLATSRLRPLRRPRRPDRREGQALVMLIPGELRDLVPGQGRLRTCRFAHTRLSQHAKQDRWAGRSGPAISGGVWDCAFPTKKRDAHLLPNRGQCSVIFREQGRRYVRFVARGRRRAGPRRKSFLRGHRLWQRYTPTTRRVVLANRRHAGVRPHRHGVGTNREQTAGAELDATGLAAKRLGWSEPSAGNRARGA